MSINNVLYLEVKKASRRVQNLLDNRATREFWELGKNDQILVCIGADIECLIGKYVEQSNMAKWRYLYEIFNDSPDDSTKKFLKALQRSVKMESISSASFDSNMFEVRPLPGSPEEIITRFNLMEKRMKRLCQIGSYDFRMGQGHWHMSLSRSKSGPVDRQHPFLQNLTNIQILDQINIPAIFIKPRQAERTVSTITTAASLIGTSGFVRGSIYTDPFNRYADGNNMREIRLAHMAPCLPVLMILLALERVLISRPHSKNINPSPEKLKILYDEIVTDVIPFDRDKRKIHRGKGGYLNLLEESFDSGEIEKILPGIARELKIALVESYIEYLNTHLEYYSLGYEDDERKLLQRKAYTLLESLKSPHKPDLAYTL